MKLKGAELGHCALVEVAIRLAPRRKLGERGEYRSVAAVPCGRARGLCCDMPSLGEHAKVDPLTDANSGWNC